MNSSKFQNFYNNLNPEQKQAVDSIEGPVMVVAGPGTGKTQILTLRIANILDKTQISPENILALTFSDSAARQMRGRLADIIGTPAYRVEITTFHSFANSVIQNFPEEFGTLLSAQNISEVEQIDLIEKILEDNDFNLIKPFGDPLYYVIKILSAINDLKKEGITPEVFLDSINASLKDWEVIPDLYHDKGRYKGEMKGKYADQKKDIEKNYELQKAYLLYQQNLVKEKKYDFNDMLIEVIKMLENNQRLLLLLQEKYQYFLVDEHQDTNAAQNKLVELLASFYDNPNLFVVGDEKQAIFRFQGASLENFFYFKKLYPGAKLINLTENYRSSQIILDASHSVIQNNLTASLMFETVVKLNAGKKQPLSKIKLYEAESFFEEFQGVAQDIKQKIDIGENPAEIAVLGRNNKDLLQIQDILNRYELPSLLISDTDLLQNKSVQKIILLFKTIANPLDEAGLVKTLHIDSLNIDPFDIYRLLSVCKKEHLNLLNKLIKLTEEESQDLHLESFESIKKFTTDLKNWQKIANNQGLEKLFVSVFEDSGLKNQILNKLGDYETFAKVNTFFELIKEKVYQNPDSGKAAISAYSLEDFLKFIDITIANNLSLRSKPHIFESKSINLMTAHKSKGLEFDYVYIIQSFNGHWGNKRKIASGFKLPWEKLGIKLTVSDDENEDERRLFYVAMTRARKEVFISYSKLSLDSKEQLPSQFIQEIDPKLIKIVDLKPDRKVQDLILTNFNPTPVSSKNSELIKSLFRDRGLSVTAMQNFLECPWKWFFRSLLLVPDVKSQSLIFGSAIHISLNNYLKALETSKPDAAHMLASFSKALNSEYLSETEKKRLTKQAEKVLNTFYESVAKHWKKGMFGELSVRGVKFSDDVILNGRIDLLEPISKTDAIIHDFKTGKPKSRSQIDGSLSQSKYNYLEQLVFYKLLVDKYRNGAWKVNIGAIDFVEPDQKGRIKSEIFDLTDNQVKNLENQIKVISTQILNLDFWDQLCGQKDCEWCKMRELLN